MEFFIYLIKVSGLLALFGLSYWFLLRNESFKNFNRKFLLFGLLLSFSLPLLQVTTIEFVKPDPKEALIVESSIDEAANFQLNSVEQNKATSSIKPAKEIPWSFIFFAIYLLGVIFMTLKLSKQFYTLRKLLQTAAKFKKNGIVHYQCKQPINVFSFFNVVIYCPDALNKKTLNSVLAHEYVHIKQRHSIDLMLVNLAEVFIWFNPLMYFYRKMLDENLEFIADQETVSRLENKKHYQYTLLNFIQPDQPALVGHYFFKNSTIKTRIMMLNKQKSPSIYRLKSVVIIPILITFIAFFQVETVAMQVEEEKVAETQKNNISTSYSFSVLVTALTTEEELDQLVETFKKDDINIKFSKVRRTKKGEIKGIKIKMNNADKSINTQKHVKGNKPISPIELKVFMPQNSNEKEFEISSKKANTNKASKDKVYEEWKAIRNEVDKVVFNKKELSFKEEYLIKNLSIKDFDDGVAYLEGDIEKVPNAIKHLVSDKILAAKDKNDTGKYYVLKESDEENEKYKLMTVTRNSITSSSHSTQKKDNELSTDEELQSIPRIKILESITKDSSEEDIQVFAQHFNEEANVNLNVEKLKRNKNGEITSIKIKLTDDNTNSKTVHKQQSNKGITPILLEKKNKGGKDIFVIKGTKERKTEKERKVIYITEQDIEIDPDQEDINASVKITPTLSNPQIILYVVDGKEVTGEVFGKLNPSDISEVKIEKDSTSFPNKDVEGIIFITTKKDEINDISLLLQKNNKIPWELLDQKEDLQGLMKYFNLLDDQIKSDF
ncbi:MAG: M56 family metallopeptidase, partial [Psychroflexus maritimus]